MKKWLGSAGVCINDKNEVLMVRANDNVGWALPSGGIETGETPEECCIREVMEETGYRVVILEKLLIKEKVMKDYEILTHYFKVEKMGESMGIDDPDNTIIEVGWKSITELEKIEHTYPEDIETIKKFGLKNNKITEQFDDQ
ncbi:MAG: NUDIX hydrolase [Bacillota bacterium]|jgi:8-oxo-dGTP pyrophosphatase MutT (NUDIX family)|uniref:NUDIX hydrolase n=1 Tax=Bacillus sp. RO2 TaxID=2723913 RepID=UPI00145FB526|nr:NUDIX hydrolase [Bacillus sp. RO2]MEA3322489.1 NUDIX hydrolase [Bacillota bacterium]NMH74187.1 NUDIX hydrolase [Bacillus sp. RO2]